MVKLDGIWRGGTSYPGKPYCAGSRNCQMHHKTGPTRRPRSGKGAEGGRSAGSTVDPGPEKPGNRVEDKTLETGERLDKEEIAETENPPLATVNIHLKVALEISKTEPGCLNNVS
jgi:hypothetical protein